MRKLPVLSAFLSVALAFSSGAAEPSAGEARFLSHGRQLTFEGKRSGEGYFSPDGNMIIFQSERDPENPFYQIYLLNLISGETARVSPGVGKTTCSFFQPGTSRVLFASTHLDPDALKKQKEELEFRASGKMRRYSWDYDPAYEIFSANEDGTQIQQLTHSLGYDAEGAYSPDGKRIVFCSTRAAYPLERLTPDERRRFEKEPSYFGDIYTMNADGSDVQRLTSSPGYDGGPFFSPDGARIVWRHFDESGMIADVWTMKTDGSDKRRITDFKSMSWAPFYHPSGKYIIFTSNKLGFENFELYLVDVNGEREPVRVTYTDGFDGLPTFAPEGKRLCWTSTRTDDKSSQLFLADWNDEAALQALEASPRRSQTAPVATTAPAAPIQPPVSAGAGVSAEITRTDLEREVRWLADPAREGRMTGSPGAQQSAEWLAQYFQHLGLQPVGGSYFQSFDFNAGERMLPGGNKLALTSATADGKPAGETSRAFTVDHDFRPLAFSDNGEVQGEVVFAGYGLSVPEAKDNPIYNSFQGLDVKDKIVLVLRYVPEGVKPERRAHLNRYAGLRYKAMMAHERGAKAVLFVSGPNSPQAGELIPLAGDNTLATAGIIADSITLETAAALLAPSGKSLRELQSALDDENPHAAGGFLIPKTRVELTASVEHIKKTDRNVLAMLPPEGGDPASAEYVVIGAHYDHLGRGSSSSSLARSGEEGKIHPGADDNASGDATVMELAASFAGISTGASAGAKLDGLSKPASLPARRGIIFALWSGEEIGLIGSAAFCEHPPIDLSKVVAYINFDMVGRLRENHLTLQGIGSSHLWRREVEKRNVAAGFNLTLQDDPYLPTDTTSFYPKRIPVLNFFTGAHEDYHRPTDTPEKLNYEGIERIARFARQIVQDVAAAPERPDYAHVQKSSAESGSRDTLRAYLGTIPDYSSDVKGVKLSGVRGESPAEKGGLQSGDIIVEFAGHPIADIYAYTYALDSVKIGQPVKITVERSGKKVDLTVTPEARH